MHKHLAIHKQRGFTILELLVVMVIIAILVSLSLRAFGTIQVKSRDSRRKQDLQAISKALEMYYNDFGHYPLSAGGLILGCGQDAEEACSWGGVFQNTANETLYMVKIPKDSSGSQYYYSSSDGSSYYLFAYLENEEDPQIALGADDQPTFYTGTSCSFQSAGLLADSCNYVIMSSNIVDQPVTLN